MKRILYFSLTIVAILAIATSCNQVSFKKTKSGLLYKIVSSTKDSVVKPNQWLKLNFVQKLNDSVLQTSYGKTPVYVKIPPTISEDYSPMEVFGLLRKGDSSVVVMQIDSLLSKKLMQQLPPFMKKGDKINWSFQVLDLFPNDSLYMADQQKEMEKDAPRRAKAEEEQRAAMMKEMKTKNDAEEAELEKTGEISRGIKVVQDYLAAKKITAQEAGKGTYVSIINPGTGAQAADGKFVQVKYDGKRLATDSTFEAGNFERKLGEFQLISGMEDGLKAFKQGGKGTIYIPGYRAYGANPRPGSPFKPFDALRFDVEILTVSDTAMVKQQPMMPPQRN